MYPKQGFSHSLQIPKITKLGIYNKHFNSVNYSTFSGKHIPAILTVRSSATIQFLAAKSL